MRRLLSVFCLLLAGLLPQAGNAAEVTDLAGRTVRLDRPAERILLGEGRYLAAIAILDRDAPLRRVAGMMGEFPLLDPGGYAQWTAQFPALTGIPLVGKAAPDSFSIESAIALKPDLAVFGLAGHGPGPQQTETIAALEAAGIRVAFIDFFLDPVAHTTRSIALLGALMGRQAEATAFAAAYETELRRVTAPLAGVTRRPRIFLENRVGLQEACCASVGNGVIGRLVEQAGGRNMAADLIPGQIGTVSLEYLLANQPDIYLGTAIGSTWTAEKLPQRIAMGPGVPAAMAQASLRHSLQRTGIADLQAVRQGRAYALWHHFFHSPFNVVALQAMATWFHPDLFAGLDPAATHRDLVRRFQPVPLEGTYWTTAR